MNLTVDKEKVLSWQLKQPFDELLKTRFVLIGREEATLFEPLAEAILSHLKPTNIDINTIVLAEINQIQGISGKGFIYRY